MVTLRDRAIISALPVDLLGPMVLSEDGPSAVARFCDGFDGELILHAPEELRCVEDLVAGFTVDVSHAYLGMEQDANARGCSRSWARRCATSTSRTPGGRT